VEHREGHNQSLPIPAYTFAPSTCSPSTRSASPPSSPSQPTSPRFYTDDHPPLTSDGAPYIRALITTRAVFTDPILDGWSSWDASHRIVGLRRWMLDMEWNWGSIAMWPALCMAEWANVKERDSAHVTAWLAECTKKASSGHRMLGYLGRIMEGNLPADVDVLRDLYLQSHQLTCTFNTAITALEITLSAIQSDIQTHTARRCGCGKATCVA